jgi:ribosomal protein S20
MSAPSGTCLGPKMPRMCNNSRNWTPPCDRLKQYFQKHSESQKFSALRRIILYLFVLFHLNVYGDQLEIKCERKAMILSKRKLMNKIEVSAGETIWKNTELRVASGDLENCNTNQKLTSATCVNWVTSCYKQNQFTKKASCAGDQITLIYKP